MARIKLSAAQALQLIQQLGVDAELVADDQTSKDQKFDDAIASVDQSRGKILRPDMEAKIKEELTTSLAGKFGGDLRANLRRLSGGVLKTSDLKDLKDDEAIQKFLDIMIGQKDQSLEEIREQQRKASLEWEQEKAKIIADEQKKYIDLKETFLERDRDTIYESILSAIPRTGGNIKVQAQAFKNYVRSLYKDHYDEAKKDIELRELSNPEKIALQGNIAVQLKDVGTKWAEESGILKSDMRNEDPGKILAEQGAGVNHQTTILGDNSFSADMKSFEDKLMAE